MEKFGYLTCVEGEKNSGENVQSFAIFARKIVYLEYEGTT